MSALLSSPSPPQIMPLIINRMRACSSWKAGTGTSLLNGAAQLGLKLFNRNMKAPSVRHTRPSEVTGLSLPSQQPCPPRAALLPQGQGSALHPALPSTQLLLLPPPMPAAPSSSHLPFFSSWDPSSPLPGRVCINPMLKPGLGSLLLSMQSQTCRCSDLPLGWPVSVQAADPFVLHAVCPPQPALSCVGGRAEPCPALLHCAVHGETELFREGESQGCVPGAGDGAGAAAWAGRAAR